jgi:hypothetical protein
MWNYGGKLEITLIFNETFDQQFKDSSYELKSPC